MRSIGKKTLSLLMVLAMLVSLFASLSLTASAAEPTNASEVNYRKSGKYVYNWGKRDTTATFLTTYAQSYYTGSYSYATLSALSGSSSTSASAFYSSPLGSAIHNMLYAKQTSTTSYNGTKDLYQYTDCEQSGNKISSYYSAVAIGPGWGEGGSWNREHTWPNSKGLNGADENDIMMLRPTATSENSSRGNDAYGEGSSYYNPNEHGQKLHGDVARLMLQHLMRWGNTSKFYGSGGVMESRAVLLKWMIEDPVDTWEMGRNDAVQSITGVRNVFVDYPELAFKLLGAEMPANYPTPSNGGGSAPVVYTVTAASNNTAYGTVALNGNVITATAKSGYEIDSAAPYTVTPSGAATVTRKDNTFTVSNLTKNCTVTINFKALAVCTHEHTKTETKEATCTEGGYERVYCLDCGADLMGAEFPALGHDYQETVVAPTCTAKGYTEYTCSRCGDSYKKKFTAMVDHKYENGKCAVCGAADPSYKPEEDKTPKYGDFSDLKTGRWYEAGVTFALKNGLMNGVGGGKFDPDGSVTRGMLVTILYRVEKTPSVEGMKNPFTDVKSGAWYTDAIVWAADQGIVNGTSATTFAPDAFITREQIATILYRYAKAEKTEKDLSAYPDAGTVSGYAVDAMRWAVAEGLINGKDGRLAPQENATRAQIATILERYLSK